MSLTQIQKELEENSQESQTRIEQLMQNEKQSQIEELTSIMQEQSKQIEEYKTLLAEKEEDLNKANIKNIQIQETMEDTQDKLNSCMSAYNGLRNHPKIKIERETVIKEIPTIDNRVYIFLFVSAIVQVIVVLFHLYNSEYTDKLREAFFYDIKIFFKYLISDFRIIAVAFVILAVIICISLFLISLYKNDDGTFLIFYLGNITFGFLIMDEPMTILSFKISHLIGFDYLGFHPFYLWFITMIITFFIFSIITTIKNYGKNAKSY